jgi:radical SAM protein with 4Fe4S-binding SPASM domain
VLRRYLRRSVRFPGVRLRERSRRLTVRMDTTNICNLRCSMCPMVLSDRDPDRDWHHMDPALFTRIERDVFPLAHTVGLSCGAEPFCNPDFGEYLARLHRADVPVREVVTNGTLLTDGNIGSLLRTPPTTLFVSVDGARAETHAAIRGGAALDAILERLSALVELRGRSRFPMLAFSTTLQRLNLDELPAIVKMAATAGAVSVGVVPLVPYAGLERAGETVDMDSPEVMDTVSRAREAADGRGITLVVTTGTDANDGEGCGFLDGWVYIDPDGKVFPCPHWNTSHPLGNLTGESFEDIMNGESYRELREMHRSGSLSGNCAVCPEMNPGARGEPEKV